ncbi:MAG: hypothetical protein AAGG68_11720 [Bacteroidota bacterium]
MPKNNDFDAEYTEGKPRRKWKSSFREMHLNGDDELLIPDVFEEEDFSAKTDEEDDKESKV